MGGPCDTCDGDPFLYVVHEGNPITVRCPDCAVPQLERAERQVAAMREALESIETRARGTGYAMSEDHRITDARRRGLSQAAEYIRRALETP